jgi:hypothetical protein
MNLTSDRFEHENEIPWRRDVFPTVFPNFPAFDISGQLCRMRWPDYNPLFKLKFDQIGVESSLTQ